MFNPSDYAADVTEDAQQRDNTYIPPPSGSNVVVCTGFQRVFGTGKNGDWARLKLFFKVAKALNEAPANQAAVGRTVTPELWANWEKEYNARKLAAICIAVGVEEQFDPDDDAQLLDALCGKPFGLSHELKQRSYKDRNGNDQLANEFKIIVAKPLKDKKLVKFAKDLVKDPDFEKTYGAKVVEARDNRTGTTAEGSNKADGFYDSDDLPF